MHSRIYVINKLNIKEDYAKKVTQTFGSGLTPIDFRFTDNAISEINKYVSFKIIFISIKFTDIGTICHDFKTDYSALVPLSL